MVPGPAGRQKPEWEAAPRALFLPRSLTQPPEGEYIRGCSPGFKLLFHTITRGPFMSFLTRRDFLHDSAALAAALASAGMFTDPLAADTEKSTAAKKGSANDQLRVAVVGVRGRGMS